MLVEGRVRAIRLMQVRAENRAQATAHGVYGLIRETDIALLAIRDGIDTGNIYPSPSDDSPARTDAMHQVISRHVKRVPHVSRIHVVSALGNYVYSSVSPVPRTSIGERAYFLEQKFATTDELKVSDVTFGKTSARWGIYITRRMTSADGSFKGIVFAVLEPSPLAKEMTAVDRSQWILALFDRSQRFIASNQPQNAWTGRRFTEPLLRQGLASNRATFRGIAIGQTEPYIWAAEKVEGLSLLTVAGYSERSALSQWYKDLNVNLAVGSVLILGCLIILRTQRKVQRSAQALSAVNERMRLAATSVQLGVWELDFVTGIVTWDTEMSALYACDSSETVQSKAQWLEYVIPEDRGKLCEVLGISAASPFEERIRIRTKRGELRHMRVAGVVQHDERGRPRCVVGIHWDVTHLERALHELQTSEAYFRTLFDAVPSAVAVVEAGIVVDNNRPYRELFLTSAEEIRPPWLLSPTKQPDGSASEEAGLRMVERVRLSQLESVFMICRRADGTQFETEMTAKLFLHDHRELFVVTVRDLTDQRKLEEQLHQAQKLDALGQLAGGVAHDFNNMLTAILASAEMLSVDEPEEVQRELRGTIVSAAERAAQLTRKLLAFARKGKIRSTPTDVHKVIRETVALLVRTLDRKIEIVTDLAATRSIVLGDSSQLQSALLNLGVNARDAMPEGGSIVFRTADVTLDAPDNVLGAFRVSPGDYVRISVLDSGVGISEDNLKYVFDPFFTTKEVGKGTGLGLAAVFGTMASHRGAVTVESDLGKGTCFSLYLPLTIESEPKEPNDVARLPKGQGVVLVVDDEDLVRTATRMQVESLGYCAIAEGEPLRAIETFKRIHTKLSAVLLDMVMPRMSGLDVLVRLREIDATVPIILVSGFTRTDQLDVAHGRSIAGFLQKPFAVGELRRLLSEICGTQDGRTKPSSSGNQS